MRQASETFANLPEDKRQRVLDAAIEEFAEHGFQGASMNR
ncbi:MAG TPA: TetR/AcrR family transcriptional regulator, partial [Desulfovibrio sp.]|nr:TetR/AcrR family transcriptional regulator [Desulfovibrio sp.]